MKRWTPAESEQVVLFPYARLGGGYQLVPEK